MCGHVFVKGYSLHCLLCSHASLPRLPPPRPEF
ncbi:hypothetical protein CORC01_09971 [Colletotrichum orchidophilum]|uniref:Uncharacterized protein n=1 Tax=Colletotrichum orchidophilum TaxID=1209926 RepID=A0A1G4B039_9PEZI|nr:uncharacterized protein CORC01_09971 [Colletotrichum orchidophilum]OHE94754.1 hypothetical protein CORC01_09971 [Colletotrichum orchidophilum]